jgi:hypothetical protein
MVDQSEIQQMNKFMAALDGGGSAVATTAPGTDSIDAMKTILERFHSATDNLLADTRDAELQEAMLTEQTKLGAKIGGWEICARQSGRRRLYDVVHSATQERVAADLMLYEAARRLVRILNGGGHLNCQEAVNILRSEQEYAGAIHDMVLFRHKLTKYPTSPRAAIFEARYDDAKRRALIARNRL